MACNGQTLSIAANTALFAILNNTFGGNPTGNLLPAHTHTGAINMQMQANSSDGIDPNAPDGYPSRFTGAYSDTANCTMAAPTTNFTVDASSPVPTNICSPFLVVNYIICVAGIFPSRN